MGQRVEIKCIHPEFRARKWTVCSGGAKEVLGEDLKHEMMKVGVSVTSGV